MDTQGFTELQALCTANEKVKRQETQQEKICVNIIQLTRSVSEIQGLLNNPTAQRRRGGSQEGGCWRTDGENVS